MEARRKRQRKSRLIKIFVIVFAVALFYGANAMLKPEPLTRSDNSRFDDWARYFTREGYTFEYRNFDTFPDMVDIMYRPVGSPTHQAILTNVFAISVRVFSLGPEFVERKRAKNATYLEALGTPLIRQVTVYYDDEKDIMFFVGNADSSIFFYAARAANLTATYGYYCRF